MDVTWTLANLSSFLSTMVLVVSFVPAGNPFLLSGFTSMCQMGLISLIPTLRRMHRRYSTLKKFKFGSWLVFDMYGGPLEGINPFGLTARMLD